MDLDRKFFFENFNTNLSPEENARFIEWINSKKQQTGRDYALDIEDYDLQGLFKAGLLTSSENGHFTDQYKKPNHPTFSEQSQYNKYPSPLGGFFQGGTWAKDGSSFTPSSQMLKTTHPLSWLLRYMEDVEPNVKLNMDRKGLLK